MRYFLLFTLMGCAPTLDQVTRTTQGFAAAQRCSQGPFEFHVAAFGSRWGEDITVEARGNAISGHSSVDVAGQHDEHVIGATGPVEASACTLSDADRSAAAASSSGTSPIPTTTDTSATASSSSGSSVGSVKLVVAGIPNTWIYRTEVARYHNEVTDWGLAQSVLKPGQDVKIIFWSERPLDMQNTFFVVSHSEMRAPGGDDKKWQAHLDDVRTDAAKAQAEATAKAKKDEAEAQAKAQEETRCAAVQGPDKKCHSEGIKTGSELAVYAAFQHKCEDMARRNAADQACRDDGWRNDNERPHDDNASSTVATTTEQATPPSPTRPPPAPQAETQPPKPSVHADWVPGSWQWNGSDWGWLGGGWRVPDQDRQQGLTATAPTAPPTARIETRPPQPVASAVWADGYWHYDRGQWVWVAGHWAIPPRLGATWRPSTWIPAGAQLRLDPGGWR